MYKFYYKLNLNSSYFSFLHHGFHSFQYKHSSFTLVYVYTCIWYSYLTKCTVGRVRTEWTGQFGLWFSKTFDNLMIKENLQFLEFTWPFVMLRGMWVISQCTDCYWLQCKSFERIWILYYRMVVTTYYLALTLSMLLQRCFIIIGGFTIVLNV